MNLKQLAVVPHLRSQFSKHWSVKRCSSSMTWLCVQELSQQCWPLLLVSVMHLFPSLSLLSYIPMVLSLLYQPDSLSLGYNELLRWLSALTFP